MGGLIKAKERTNFTRQEGIFDPANFANTKIQIIGVGSVGSFVALALAKMGIKNIEVWDDDRVETHNLPNQFYMVNNLGAFKVDALSVVINMFCGRHIKTNVERYNGQQLGGLVISAVDSIGTRKFIWENVVKDTGVTQYIDTRMGGNLMRIYSVNLEDKKSVNHYEKSLHVGDTMSDLKCTERTILYNVLAISGIVGSLVVKMLKKETIPKEIIFDMKHYHFMLND